MRGAPVAMAVLHGLLWPETKFPGKVWGPDRARESEGVFSAAGSEGVLSPARPVRRASSEGQRATAGPRFSPKNGLPEMGRDLSPDRPPSAYKLAHKSKPAVRPPALELAVGKNGTMFVVSREDGV